MPDQLAIRALHLISPVGHDAPRSCAAIRARLNRFGEHPELAVAAGDDEDGDVEEAAVVARCPVLPPGLEGSARLTALVLECLRSWIVRERVPRQRIQESAILVALPGPDPVTDGWALDEQLGEGFLDRAGLPAPAHFETIRAGHVGVLALVERAFSLLESGRARTCLVVGADSYLDSARIASLDEARRIASSANPDGFVPGEAVGLLLLEPPGADAPLALVGRPSFGEEPNDQRGDLRSTGRGLTESVRGLGGEERFGRVLCDLNQESYRFFEWGLLRGRLADRFREDLRLVHPAESVGDVGAATGALLLGCAVESFRRGYTAESRVLITTASDDARRASLLCSRAP